MEIIGQILGGIMTIGVFIAGLGYLYERFVSGRGKKDEEDRAKNQEQTRDNTAVLDLMRKQVESLSELVGEHTEQLQKSREKIIILQTQVDEKDKKLQEYVAIFQGRDPRMDAFMMTAGQYMETTSKTILKLQQWLDKTPPEVHNI